MEDSVISIGLADLEGVNSPHEDVLVIRVTIANYEVARVLVDSESSVNILFMEAFDLIQIDLAEL